MKSLASDRGGALGFRLPKLKINKKKRRKNLLAVPDQTLLGENSVPKGAFEPRGVGTLVSIRTKDIDGTLKGERRIEEGLNDAAVAALTQKFAKISASQSKGKAVAQKKKLIRAALNEKRAGRLARRLGVNHPQLAAVPTFALALFDERLAHEVGNLVLGDPALLGEVFGAYLRELPRMSMIVDGDDVDVVAEEAVNPLACAAVDWAYARFAELLPEHLREKRWEEAANLLLLGHLFGKFDTDPAREQHLQVLAANLDDHYPNFAKKLVGDRLEHNIEFQRISTELAEIRTARRRVEGEREDVERSARRGGPLGPNESRASRDERLKAQRCAVGMAEQKLRARTDRLRGQFARAVGRLSRSDQPGLTWKGLAARLRGAVDNKAALKSLYRALRGIDAELATEAELDAFVQEKIVGDRAFRGFRGLFEGPLAGASSAEHIAAAAQMLLLLETADQAGLRPQEADWMLRAVGRLLKKPPELEDVASSYVVPAFDERDYAVRAQRGVEKLRDADESAWISNQDPQVGEELRSRLQAVEDVLGSTKEIRKLLKNEGRLGITRWVTRRIAELSALASMTVGYIGGHDLMTELDAPVGILGLITGLLSWQAISLYLSRRADRKAARAREAKGIELDSRGFKAEFNEMKERLFGMAKRFRRRLGRFMTISLLMGLAGWTAGVNEPEFSQSVYEFMDERGLNPGWNLGVVSAVEGGVAKFQELIDGEAGEGQEIRTDRKSTDGIKTSDGTETDGPAQGEAEGKDGTQVQKSGGAEGENSISRDQPANYENTEGMQKTTFYTFRPDDYPVDFWVEATGHLDDNGLFKWDEPAYENAVTDHRNFDSKEALLAAIDRQVERGRMVVLNVTDSDKMEYPVGSEPIEVLTLGAREDVNVVWSGSSGLHINKGKARPDAVAVVFDPMIDRDEIWTANDPELGNILPADPAVFDSVPHVAALVERAGKDRAAVGSKEAMLRVLDSIDRYVDYGLTAWTPQHDSDEEFIAALMETKNPVRKDTPGDSIELVNDKWICNQFAAFVHWVDRQSGGTSRLLSGHADTREPGPGPSLPHMVVTHKEANDWYALDVSLPAGPNFPEQEPPQAVDLDEVLDQPMPLWQIIAYGLAGIAALGGARKGLEYYLQRRNRPEAKPLEEIAELFEPELVSLPAPASIGVLMTLRRAIEFWLSPRPGHPLAEMSEAERVDALTRTYLHEIGLVQRPRSTESGWDPTADDILELENRSAPLDQKGARTQLAKLITAVSTRAEVLFDANDDEERAERFFAAQSLLGKLAAHVGAPTGVD